MFYYEFDRGESYTQPTFVTHPWVVTDAADRCLTVVTPIGAADARDYSITV